MNAVSAACDAPIHALRLSRLKQSWIPSERNGDCPTISQRDTEVVFREFHVGASQNSIVAMVDEEALFLS